MRIGILGFKGSGKSTLFRAMAGERIAGGTSSASGPLGTSTHGEDPRFLALCEMFAPKKRSPISFTLVDYPGIEPPGGAAPGFNVSAARDEVEGLILAVRGFATDAYFYPRPGPDAVRDARELTLELILADLEVITRRVEKLEVSVRKPTPRQEEERRELALLERIRDGLEAEVPVKEMDLSADETRMLKGFGLLTAKPWLLLVNGPDEAGPTGSGRNGNGCHAGPFEDQIELPVKLESELLQLPPDERREFIEDLGVGELALTAFPDRLLAAMGMIRFYTASEKEVHVWEVAEGANAPTAAGKIHTDLQRGFIRAEVVDWKDLVDAGDMRTARAAGTARLEGRDYAVKDGDVLDIRFSV